MSNAKLVAELMTTSVKTVTPDQYLDLVCQLMTQHKITCVIVVDKNDPDQPVGIITERRIVSFLSDHPTLDPAHVVVEDLIGPTLYTTEPEESLINALAKCRDLHIRHLVVVSEEKKLLGVISYTDIVDDTFAEISKHIALSRELGNQNCQRSMVDVMQDLALRDPMTNTGNRRSMDLDLNHAWDLAKLYHRPFCISLIDVDYFKRYNDKYGHMGGDKALVSVVQTIKENIRVTDRLYRYGGEEFLLLLPETTADTAIKLSERITLAVRDAGIQHIDSPFGIVTISSGIASTEAEYNINTPLACEKDLIEKADAALYAAKASGRNQAIMHFPESDQARA